MTQIPVDDILILLVLRRHLNMMVVEVHQLEIAHVIALQGTTTHTELLLLGRLRRPKQAHCSSKQQQLHATTILLSAATLHTQYHTQDKYHYQFIYSYHLSTLNPISRGGGADVAPPSVKLFS